MEDASKKRKMLPFWALIIIDVLGICSGMGVYLLFDYIMPHKLDVKTEVVAEVDSSRSFDLPSDSSQADTADSESEPADSISDHDLGKGKRPSRRGDSEPEREDGKRNLSNQYTYNVESDESEFRRILDANTNTELIGHSRTDNADVSVYEKSLLDGDEKITYYLADVYVSNAGDILTAFAEDTFGKNIKDTVYNMAEDNNALFAVNGDYYGNAENGIVIRNGVKYRDTTNDADVLVLYTDGVMRAYLPEEYDPDEVIAQGAWQAWNFGPSLLDGEGGLNKTFNTTSYLNSKNPRSAAGYVEPGHYIFATVDGRDKGYSSGATLSELAAIMSKEGCVYAYNLDGGKSAMMYFDGRILNRPDGGGRDMSDIIYVERQEAE
ncbi:MAG: phosphodiester glycosidase family protein [Ruminococcus sp.]|nr:phosphodiester glycosidase family protein [Ruminococcus sp.]